MANLERVWILRSNTDVFHFLETKATFTTCRSLSLGIGPPQLAFVTFGAKSVITEFCVKYNSCLVLSYLVLSIKHPDKIRTEQQQSTILIVFFIC